MAKWKVYIQHFDWHIFDTDVIWFVRWYIMMVCRGLYTYIRSVNLSEAINWNTESKCFINVHILQIFCRTVYWQRYLSYKPSDCICNAVKWCMIGTLIHYHKRLTLANITGNLIWFNWIVWKFIDPIKTTFQWEDHCQCIYICNCWLD